MARAKVVSTRFYNVKVRVTSYEFYRVEAMNATQARENWGIDGSIYDTSGGDCSVASVTLAARQVCV